MTLVPVLQSAALRCGYGCYVISKFSLLFGIFMLWIDQNLHPGAGVLVLMAVILALGHVLVSVLVTLATHPPGQRVDNCQYCFCCFVCTTCKLLLAVDFCRSFVGGMRASSNTLDALMKVNTGCHTWLLAFVLCD